MCVCKVKCILFVFVDFFVQCVVVVVVVGRIRNLLQHLQLSTRQRQFGLWQLPQFSCQFGLGPIMLMMLRD